MRAGSRSKAGSDLRRFGSGTNNVKDAGNGATDKRSAAGSDDSTRRGNARMEEMDRVQVREKYDRCVFAYVELIRRNEATSKEGLGQSGLIFVSKQLPIQPPATGASWAYKRAMRSVVLDGLPQGNAIIIHPGDQRYFLRSKKTDDVAVYLDLTRSESRDRLFLHDKMEIHLIDTSSKVEKKRVLRALVPLGGNSDTDLSWHKELVPDELWKLRQQPTIKAPSKTGEDAAARAAQNSVKMDMTKKSVSWGVSVDMADGRVSALAGGQDDDDFSSSSVDDGTIISADTLARKAANLSLDGRDIVTVSEASDRQCVLFSKKRPEDLDKDAGWLHESIDFGDGFALTVSMELGGCQVLLPRAHTLPPTCKILLLIPSTVAFPLVPGDSILIRQNEQDVGSIVLRIPKLFRSPPSVADKADDANPSQCFRALGLEVCQQNVSNSRQTMQAVEARACIFSKRYFATNPTVRIGRSEGDITVLDPHLSRHHAIFQKAAKYVLLEPEDISRTIFMLCGKSDSHSRPPMALRSGDTILCGKSEFKVVFQQRGNREIQAGATPCEELRARLRPRNHELRARSNHPFGHQAAATETTDENNNIEDDADSAVLREQFKNLKVDAREASKSLISPSAVFQDMNSLKEHFDERDFGTGPIMILLTVRGPKQKQFYLCDPLETVIGSGARTTISISNDKRMSPNHCRLYFDPVVQRWMIEDLQSKHGTFVKVEEPTLVSIGDVYVMGSTLVRVLGQPMAVHPVQQSNSGRCISQ